MQSKSEISLINTERTPDYQQAFKVLVHLSKKNTNKVEKTRHLTNFQVEKLKKNKLINQINKKVRNLFKIWRIWIRLHFSICFIETTIPNLAEEMDFQLKTMIQT